MIDSTAEALEIIKSTGYKIGRISTKAIVDELIKEDGVSMDFLESTDIVKEIKVDPKVTQQSDLQIAQSILRKREEEELQARIKASQETTLNTLRNLGDK